MNISKYVIHKTEMQKRNVKNKVIFSVKEAALGIAGLDIYSEVSR